MSKNIKGGRTMFFVKDGDVEYRVDKDEKGGIVRGNGKYIEINEVVYEVLKAYEKGKMDLIIHMLKSSYECDDKELCDFMMILKETVSTEGVFQTLEKDIVAFLERSKQDEKDIDYSAISEG